MNVPPAANTDDISISRPCGTSAAGPTTRPLPGSPADPRRQCALAERPVGQHASLRDWPSCPTCTSSGTARRTRTMTVFPAALRPRRRLGHGYDPWTRLPCAQLTIVRRRGNWQAPGRKGISGAETLHGREEDIGEIDHAGDAAGGDDRSQLGVCDDVRQLSGLNLVLMGTVVAPTRAPARRNSTVSGPFSMSSPNRSPGRRPASTTGGRVPRRGPGAPGRSTSRADTRVPSGPVGGRPFGGASPHMWPESRSAPLLPSSITSLISPRFYPADQPSGRWRRRGLGQLHDTCHQTTDWSKVS